MTGGLWQWSARFRRLLDKCLLLCEQTRVNGTACRKLLKVIDFEIRFPGCLSLAVSSICANMDRETSPDGYLILYKSTSGARFRGGDLIGAFQKGYAEVVAHKYSWSRSVCPKIG